MRRGRNLEGIQGIRSFPETFLDELDEPSEGAPVIELGPGTVATTRVGGLMRVVIFADVPMLVPLAHHKRSHLFRQRLAPLAHRRDVVVVLQRPVS